MYHDWDMAIERNRKPLLAIVATLFAVIGLEQGKLVERLACPLYRVVLSVLIPAESAVRRLIVVAARNLVITPAKAQPALKENKPSSKGQGKRKDQDKGRTVFRLIDPRKRFALIFDPFGQGELAPRLYGFASPVKRSQACKPQPIVPAPDGTVSAARLCRRLLAIKAALDDLSSQARRYARWLAKPVEQRQPPVISPLRPGHAPGWRKKPSHRVDQILKECHELAYDVPKPAFKPDTS